MKKTTIIAISAIIVFVIIIFAIVGVIFVNLNKEKPSVTASEFYTIMSEKGYLVKDVNSQFAEYDFINQVYVAANENYTYQIEFYEFSDVANAMTFYANSKSIFESSKGSVSGETDVNLKNSSKYTLSSDGKYMVASRIDNTVIFVKVNDNYKDDIKVLLNELGY